tara:strand:- start:27675 stop:28046 length:372 start_codon:yes stop_codon:yes gene_type:complete
MPTLANHANLTDAQAHKLVEQVRPLATLDEVIRWGQRQPTERMILEILVQDERCHDVVMEWELGKHLVFDTTCLGAVTTVSVWDYRPSPEEILQMRVVSGWKPPTTSTVDRGHAPCPVTELEL